MQDDELMQEVLKTTAKEYRGIGGTAFGENSRSNSQDPRA
jgi:hypothetical protein